MKTLLFFLFTLFLSGIAQAQDKPKDHTVALKQADLENNDTSIYEIIIIDPGFESWLISEAKPMGYHTQTYLEGWNRQYVSEWNYRYTAAMNTDIIENYIDYDGFTDYGLELNYKLYNYFIYAERKYNLQLLHRAGY